MMRLPATRFQNLLVSSLWSTVLAVGLTWPLALHPSTMALGSGQADGMKHLWTLWWMRASVWEGGVLPFHTTLVNFPVGMDLYPIEPLNGLVAVLLPFIPVVLLSNLLVLANLIATGVAGAWLGREVSGRPLGGLVAGTLLEGSAIMAFFVHVGVGELLHLWWLPLGLATLLRARRTLRWRWSLGLAVALVGALLSCFYIGFFLALSVLVYALSTLWAGRGTPALLLKLTVAAALSLAVVWPVTQAFSTSYKSGSVPEVGLIEYVTGEHGQPVTDPPAARLELPQLVRYGRQATSREEAAYGGGRYLGWFALTLALVGLIRDPRRAAPWLAVGAAGLVIAVGTYLTLDGDLVRVGGARLRMPLLWLNRALGYVAEPLNFPARALAITTVAVSALAALAVRGRGRWLALLAPLAVVEVAWGGLLDWPWDRFAPRDASALTVMADKPAGAVLDLALAVRSDNENRWGALSTQIVHGRALNAVPVERIEYFARDGAFFFKATTLYEDLAPLYENRDASLAGDYRADLAVLRDAGFGYLLVTYRGGRERIPTRLVSALDGLCGPAVARGPGLGMWSLPVVSFTDTELAGWRAEHDAAVQRLARMTPGMGPQKPR